MKKIVEEISGEGLEKFLGERITLFCLDYIYTGKLMGVNAMCVLLSEPAIVYETGPFAEKRWKYAESLPNDFYVMTQAITGFGIVK